MINSLIFKIVTRLGLKYKYIKFIILAKDRFNIEHGDSRRLKVFYKQFITNGSLVFDIGANVGNRTRVFESLGADVLCVEANKNLADILKTRFKAKKVRILNVGCGAVNSKQTFYESDNHLVSTFSKKFIDYKLNNQAERAWDNGYTVDIMNLDSIVEKYGVPDFCKIDVEGMEVEVLSGLTQKVGVVSFEFNTPDFKEETFTCLGKLKDLGYTKFNISFKESLVFHFSDWINADELLSFIKDDPSMNSFSYGDIYAK